MQGYRGWRLRALVAALGVGVTALVALHVVGDWLHWVVTDILTPLISELTDTLIEGALAIGTPTPDFTRPPTACGWWCWRAVTSRTSVSRFCARLGEVRRPPRA